MIGARAASPQPNLAPCHSEGAVERSAAMPPRQQQSPAQAGRIRCHQWRRRVSDSEWKLPTQGIASPPTAARCAAATAARNDRGRRQFARRGRDSGSQGQRDRWRCARRLRHSEGAVEHSTAYTPAPAAISRSGERNACQGWPV